MDLQRIVTILLRRWWLVLGMPALVLGISLVLLTTSPYVASLRATVLIPGDTQQTGNAERPELMVLDDVTQLVTSPVFATAVAAQMLQSSPQFALSADQIQDSLSADYYSRIVSVRANREDDQEALAIVETVRLIFQDQINSFLIATGAQPATIRVVEPPAVARDSPATGQFALIIQTLVALGIGCGLAALAAAFDQRVHSRSDAVTVLPVPVLGDLRASDGSGGSRWWRSRTRTPVPGKAEPTTTGSSDLTVADEPVRALRATLEALGTAGQSRNAPGSRAFMLVGVDRDDWSVSGVTARLGTVCAAAGERCLVIDAAALVATPDASTVLTDWLTSDDDDAAPWPSTAPETLLRVVPLPHVAGGRDVMRGPRWDRALAEAWTTYDVILIAARPVAVSADAIVLARHVDGTVLLVAIGRTGGSGLVQARAAIQAAGGSVIGTVLVPAD